MAHMNVVHNAYTPAQATEASARAGVMKANMRPDKIFFSSFVAGCILAFACAATLSTNASPWYQENAPGLIRMLGAVIFPWGLATIVISGADLCTGSFMFTTVAVLQRRLSIGKLLMHWFITFFGNLCGSLLIVGLMTGEAGIFDTAPYNAFVFTFNAKKVVTPTWGMIFLRGIGANWLVCLAAFLSFQAREYFSKVVAIWWPTFAFVCLGFDHVVANMFFVPMSIFLGDPDISTGYYIWKSMIPALLGNIVGGVLMVGTMYWYLNLTGSGPVLIDGVGYQGETVGLMGRTRGGEPATPPSERVANESGSDHEGREKKDGDMV